MKGFGELDRVLKGEVHPGGAGGRRPDVAIIPLIAAILWLAAFYGVCMGIYGVSGRSEPECRQMLADAIKVPLLFSLTLFVTFPSLYVFSALVGSRLSPGDLARLTSTGLGVLIAVLAAFGPIVGFFSVTTSSYCFVVLMNVAAFALASAFGLSFVSRTLNRMLPRPGVHRASVVDPAVETEVDSANPSSTAAIEPPLPLASETASRIVWYGWLIAFAVVGAQMSWVLRPFIGSPTREFAWFRPREASFFEAVYRSIRTLFGG